MAALPSGWLHLITEEALYRLGQLEVDSFANNVLLVAPAADRSRRKSCGNVIIKHCFGI